MKLEQATSTGRCFYAWAEADETMQQAIARQFPGGLAHDATVTVYRWASDPMPPAVAGLLGRS